MLNFELTLKKCNFCLLSTKYLGHLVNGDGINTDPEKNESIVKLKLHLLN